MKTTTAAAAAIILMIGLISCKGEFNTKSSSKIESQSPQDIIEETTNRILKNEIRNALPFITPYNSNNNKTRFSVTGNETLELSGDGRVQINDAYTLPTSDGTAGQVQVTNGNGNVSWQNAGVPVGTIQMWPTATPPDGWLICNGVNVGAGTYPALESGIRWNSSAQFQWTFPTWRRK